jgi:micrococcal nuclease
LEVKEKLKKELAAAKDVVIKTEKPDSSEKYGRILGWVFLDGSDVSLNQRLINEGYAWTYGGGTKIKDFDELVAKRQVNP